VILLIEMESYKVNVLTDYKIEHKINLLVGSTLVEFLDFSGIEGFVVNGKIIEHSIRTKALSLSIDQRATQDEGSSVLDVGDSSSRAAIRAFTVNVESEGVSTTSDDNLMPVSVIQTALLALDKNVVVTLGITIDFSSHITVSGHSDTKEASMASRLTVTDEIEESVSVGGLDPESDGEVIFAELTDSLAKVNIRVISTSESDCSTRTILGEIKPISVVEFAVDSPFASTGVIIGNLSFILIESPEMSLSIELSYQEDKGKGSKAK